MTISRICLLLCVFALSSLTTSCRRSSDEVWEDTKTASNYMGKGVMSLFGKRGDSREIDNEAQFIGNRSTAGNQDFIPLQDEEMYRRLNMGDVSAIDNQPAPGEPGSKLPGIEQFIAAESDSRLRDIFKKIHFTYDSDLVKGKENMDTINAIANYMKNNSSVNIFVEGHCDERGSAAYNLSLGARRSNTVKDLLASQGIDPSRIHTISYGKERPLITGGNEQSLSQNRRAQFRIHNQGRA